jgi:hypothetical protein
MAFTFVRSLLGFAQAPVRFPVNANQTITKGMVVVFSSGKVSAGADAATAGTIAGVAMEAVTTGAAVTADDTVTVDVNPFSVFKAPFIGSATPELGTAYDFGASATEFDADDTNGGSVIPIADINTTDDTAEVIIANRFNQVG